MGLESFGKIKVQFFDKKSTSSFSENSLNRCLEGLADVPRVFRVISLQVGMRVYSKGSTSRVRKK